MNNFVKYSVVLVFAVSICMPVNAKVILKENTSYYTVTGNSGRAIRKSIQKHRMIGSAVKNQIGLTRTKMDVKNIIWEHRSGRCIVKRVDVVLEISYTLPKWKKAKYSSSRLNKNWKIFASAIATHEKTHGKIWKESYVKMHRKIEGYSFKDTARCSNIRSKIQKILNDAENIGDRRNKKFELSEKKKSSAISRAFLNVVATK